MRRHRRRYRHAARRFDFRALTKLPRRMCQTSRRIRYFSRHDDSSVLALPMPVITETPCRIRSSAPLTRQRLRATTGVLAVAAKPATAMHWPISAAAGAESSVRDSIRPAHRRRVRPKLITGAEALPSLALRARGHGNIEVRLG